jgi:hypothetical protein
MWTEAIANELTFIFQSKTDTRLKPFSSEADEVELGADHTENPRGAESGVEPTCLPVRFSVWSAD